MDEMVDRKEVEGFVIMSKQGKDTRVSLNFLILPVAKAYRGTRLRGFANGFS